MIRDPDRRRLEIAYVCAHYDDVYRGMRVEKGLEEP